MRSADASQALRNNPAAASKKRHLGFANTEFDV
jgi:hypothetical protein